MTIDVQDYNRRWLRAWTDKDVPALLSFYAEDVVYKDPQTAFGLTGHAALGAYLTGLFAATPPMRYDPDEVWPTAEGFCGRWFCEMTPPEGPATWMRGFDLVVMSGDKITVNEVYVHPLDGPPHL